MFINSEAILPLIIVMAVTQAVLLAAAVAILVWAMKKLRTQGQPRRATLWAGLGVAVLILAIVIVL